MPREIDRMLKDLPMKMYQSIVSLTLASAALVMAGCAGRASLIPNKDEALRKTSTQFAADAARRSYKADAPQGGEAPARAEVDYTLKELRIGNLSPDDWNDVEVWVNQKYVVFLPALPKQNKGEGYRHLNFQMGQILNFINHG